MSFVVNNSVYWIKVSDLFRIWQRKDFSDSVIGHLCLNKLKDHSFARMIATGGRNRGIIGISEKCICGQEPQGGLI